MAVTVKKVLLSEQSVGRVEVSGTALSAAILIHTASSSTSDLDEVFLWGTVASTGLGGTYSILVGGSTTADMITTRLETQDKPKLVIPGFVLKGNATPLTVSGFFDTATVNARFWGYVNRYTES